MIKIMMSSLFLLSFNGKLNAIGINLALMVQRYIYHTRAWISTLFPYISVISFLIFYIAKSKYTLIFVIIHMYRLIKKNIWRLLNKKPQNLFVWCCWYLTIYDGFNFNNLLIGDVSANIPQILNHCRHYWYMNKINISGIYIKMWNVPI